MATTDDLMPREASAALAIAASPSQSGMDIVAAYQKVRKPDGENVRRGRAVSSKFVVTVGSAGARAVAAAEKRDITATNAYIAEIASLAYTASSGMREARAEEGESESAKSRAVEEAEEAQGGEQGGEQDGGQRGEQGAGPRKAGGGARLRDDLPWGAYLAVGGVAATVIAYCARRDIKVPVKQDVYTMVWEICGRARRMVKESTTVRPETFWYVGWYYPGWLSQCGTPEIYAGRIYDIVNIDDQEDRLRAMLQTLPPQPGGAKVPVNLSQTTMADEPSQLGDLPADTPLPTGQATVLSTFPAAAAATSASAVAPAASAVSATISDIAEKIVQAGNTGKNSAKATWAAYKPAIDAFTFDMVVRISSATTADEKRRQHKKWVDDMMYIMAVAYNHGNADDKAAIAADIRKEFDAGASITQDWDAYGRDPGVGSETATMVAALIADAKPKLPVATFAAPKPPVAAGRARSGSTRTPAAAAATSSVVPPATGVKALISAPIGAMHADAFPDSDSDGAGSPPPTARLAPATTPAPAPIAYHQSAMAFDDDDDAHALAAFSDDE